MDEHGILEVFRTLDFEPAVNPTFSMQKCLSIAERQLGTGMPVIISVHSINFHSSLKNFRSHTLFYLDQLLSALEKNHPNLLYVNDNDLWQVVNSGAYDSFDGTLRIGVRRQSSTGVRPSVQRQGAGIGYPT